MGADVVRVLVVGPETGGSGAGVSQHVANLLATMSGSSAVECEAFAITTAREDEFIGLKLVRTLSRLMKLRRAARAFDVVHVNASVNTKSLLRDAAACRAAAAAGAVVVLQFHGGSSQAIAGWLKRSPAKGFVERGLSRAAVVMYLSDLQRTAVERAFAVPGGLLVDNYVTITEFGGSARAVPPYTLVFLGRLVPEKGVRGLIAAFRSDRVADWRLVIGGAGPLEQEVRDAAAECPGIEFRGFIGDDDKFDLLRGADALILPTRHPEGVPYALLEAAATGCALVATDIGGVSTVVRDGWNGVLLEDDDPDTIVSALNRLTAEEGLLAAMQQRSVELAETRFSPEAMRAFFEGVYRDAAARR